MWWYHSTKKIFWVTQDVAVWGLAPHHLLVVLMLHPTVWNSLISCIRSADTSTSFYPRDAMLARVIVIATCPSVRLSVTRRYCVKTKKASGMISSPSGSPKTLVFWRQISSPNSKGFPRTGASNKGRSEKFSDFLALSVNISKTVADTAKVTISD